MVTKVVACACFAALAALASVSEAQAPQSAPHPLVVRVSIPLPAGEHHGHASFETSLGETRWRVAATCSGGKEHGRLALVLASDPMPVD